MIYDGSRDADISYYVDINLPKEVQFESGSIYYHYTTDGTKLIKHVRYGIENKYTHYIGNIIYDGINIAYVRTEEGRLLPIETSSGRKFMPEYNIIDHLGNNRLTFMGKSVGGSVQVMQTNNYYPFGLTMTQNNYGPDISQKINTFTMVKKFRTTNSVMISSLDCWIMGQDSMMRRLEGGMYRTHLLKNL